MSIFRQQNDSFGPSSGYIAHILILLNKAGSMPADVCVYVILSMGWGVPRKEIEMDLIVLNSCFPLTGRETLPQSSHTSSFIKHLCTVTP